MATAAARYVIFVDEVMLAAPLQDGDFRYFADHIIPSLRPLSDAQYMEGPAVILHTFARYSYVLYRTDVYWCAEWEPGLVVVRFSPDGSMAWTAMRSPIPNFGGRVAAAEDVRSYDEDADNHQYNLVFRAWDAQFDAADREWLSFQPADAETASAYRAAVSHAERLGVEMQTICAGDDKGAAWAERCKGNLRTWAGEGIRVRLQRPAEPGAAADGPRL